METTFNRAICQYKQYSLESLPWLPIPPSLKFKDDVEKERVFQSAIERTNSSFLTPENKLNHICAGGITALVDSVINKDQGTVTMTSMVLEDSDTSYKVDLLRKMMPDLIKIETTSIYESEIAFNKQCDNTLDCCDRFRPQQQNDLLTIQKEMEESSSKDCGYIIWLNLSKNPNFLESAPSLIDHFTNVCTIFFS